MSDTDRRRKAAVSPQAETVRDESFLRRWSRRKQEAHQPPAPAQVGEPQTAEPVGAPEKILTDADMPPLESLNEDSDFSPFMSPGVSEALRRKALRKLFASPAINQRCPLDGEWFDGSGFEPLGDVITHEMREEMERAAQKLKESAQKALLDDGVQEPHEPAVPPGACGDLPAPKGAHNEVTTATEPSLPGEEPRKDQA